MNIETIKTQLRNLRLSAAARELEQVLLQHKKAVNLDWLSDLLIPSCFPDETNYGTVAIWRDHDKSTKGWWRKRDTS